MLGHHLATSAAAVSRGGISAAASGAPQVHDSGGDGAGVAPHRGAGEEGVILIRERAAAEVRACKAGGERGRGADARMALPGALAIGAAGRLGKRHTRQGNPPT